MSSRIAKLREEVRQRRKERARKPTTIALDAMGTDHGPEELLRGAFDAINLIPTLTVIATGPKDRLHSILKHHGWAHERIQIENATQVVEMKESPKDSLRKRDSSVAVAAKLVKEGRAAGMVSPGNTGATMAVAMFQWRTLPGISRPAIAAFIPHPKHPCIFLDAGANVDCRSNHMFHFGIMGAVYSRYMFHCRNPRVGLLSVGEEDSKGNELVFETQELFRDSTLNFRGNAEGRDLFKGQFDVIVCDGFVGNVMLKFGEALVEFIFEHLKSEIQNSVVSQLGALAMMPVFRNFKKTVDYSEYGGAPLLGLNGNCIICHGSSKAKAITNALRTADDLVGARVNQHITELVEKNAHCNPSKMGRKDDPPAQGGHK
ncbi:MAG: phosphate acyltransferase PlsX [Candidatus Sumerlaeaceae bacterium]|nr:phosphate acyltransferase PlsX [Candidatus Sumerlaeaceae bacterium]